METPESEMEVQCPEGETTREESQSGSRLMGPQSLVDVELFPTTSFVFFPASVSAAVAASVLTKRVSLSSRQRHLAAVCQSHCGQISGAAGWHALHHHSRLSGHRWQVCLASVSGLDAAGKETAQKRAHVAAETIVAMRLS